MKQQQGFLNAPNASTHGESIHRNISSNLFIIEHKSI